MRSRTFIFTNQNLIYYLNTKRKPPPTCLLKLNSHDIPTVNSVKLSEMIFDRELTWADHVNMDILRTDSAKQKIKSKEVKWLAKWNILHGTKLFKIKPTISRRHSAYRNNRRRSYLDQTTHYTLGTYTLFHLKKKAFSSMRTSSNLFFSRLCVLQNIRNTNV